MTGLPEFLLARIAEDEAGARRGLADPHACHNILGYCSHEDAPGDEVDGPVRFYGYARVLAECEAKRAIVELHRPLEGLNPPVEFICETCGSGENYEYPTEWPCETLKLLAQPYADHPDYRQEWRA